MLEIERKYLDVDFNELRERLKYLNGICLGAHFESNIILDNNENELLNKKELLRLRVKEWPNKVEYFLTFKAPLNFTSEKNKIREELETEVKNINIIKEIFEKLGYKKVASYEKVREEWELYIKNEQGIKEKCLIDLDELEFGKFCEVEASSEAVIEKVIIKLNLNHKKRSNNTYKDLYKLWLKEQGLPDTAHLVFSKKKLAAIRTYLGLPNRI